MSPAIVADLSKELNLSSDELTKRGILAYLEHELRLADEDVADLRDKYFISSRAELEEKIKKGAIYSHPAWEDLIAWENTEVHITRLKNKIRDLSANQ